MADTGATVKFGAEDENLTSTLNKVQKELKQVETQATETNDKFGMSFKGMAAAAAGVAIGIGAIKLAFAGVEATVASFGEALDMGGRLRDLSDRTGETAGNLLLLERSFTNAGSSADKVGPTINKLQKFITDAGDAGSAQAKVMDELGISMDQLQGKTPTEQMQVFAETITAIEDPTKRAAVAMEIFGKSGGELLPVLQNFSGELATAKDELGSMPAIMDKYNGVFDTVSDKLTVIGGKMTEFAAGVLSKIVPALELVTTVLSRFDAAGFGEKLAEMFIGGQKAMEGFSTALDALKVGEFGMAFELVWASIKLQSKQTINEVYRNFIAGFTAVKGFLMDTIGPGSAIWIGAGLGIDLLTAKFQRGMLDGALALADMFPRLWGDARKNIENNIAVTERGIIATNESISKLWNDGYLMNNLKEAGEKFPTAFKESYDALKPLMTVEADLKKVEELSTAIGEKQAVANAKAVSKAGDLYAWFMGSAQATAEIANNMDRTAQNTERVTTSQRGTNEELNKTKTLGDEITEAQERTNKPAQKHGDIVRENKKSLEGLRDVFPQIGNELEKLSQNDLAKALGIDIVKKDAQQLAQDIQKYFNDLKLKPLDELMDLDASKDKILSTLQELGEKGIKPKIDFGAWADQIDLMAKAFEDKEMKVDLDGTDSVGKIRNAIEGKPYKIDIVQSDKSGTGGKDSNATLEAIKSAVETIRTLVAKIEPKLPQTALGQ